VSCGSHASNPPTTEFKHPKPEVPREEGRWRFSNVKQRLRHVSGI
jgi:hypothetical protein